MTYLSPYEIEKGRKIRVTIPAQYRESTMFIEGVETKINAYQSEHVIVGTFEGRPKATAGFFFKSDKPIHGGLYLLAIDTPIRDVLSAKDMIKQA